MSMEPVKILLIEDSFEDAQLIREALASESGSAFKLAHANRLSTGLQHLAEEPVDVVLLDLKLPDSEGLETVGRIRAQAPRTPIVVLTASDDTAIAVEAVKRGAEDYLVKGYVQVYPNLLSRAIRYALERQRAEKALQLAHAQTEQLLRSIPSILIRVSASGAVTYWNNVAETIFQIAAADVLNRSLDRSGIRCDFAALLGRIEECRRANAPVLIEDMPFTRPDGQDGFLGVTIVPMRVDGEERAGVLIFGADVTQRKRTETERARLQEQLLRAQKMETIGRFAGGLAHDFNNYLQVILGFGWLIRSRSQKNQSLLDDLQEIIHAAESASGMVNQLLAFSRRQPLQPRALDMNQTVRSIVRLLQQFVGEHVQVDLELMPGPLTVKMDPTGLEQILMNLAANARDSMPQGGTLTIKTGRVVMPHAFQDDRPRIEGGEHVHLAVQDTGVGMEAGVAAHIFEPFFTTKQTGKGTGLGLAVVYGLVQQHEGFIDVETAPGRGTTFHLYFPYQPMTAEEQAAFTAAQEGDGRQAMAAAAPAGAGIAAAGQRARPRVLVVDDDPAIRRLCERMLKKVYEVTVVPSGRAALEELERRRYDLLLSDLRMPNMDGVTLLKEALKLKDAPRLMAMTGSVTRELEERLQSVPLGTEVLHKPFTAPRLIEVITACLSARY